jgi:peptidoglycan/xylan/chitin deacetylase (PgdA/CDA1 family)
VAPSTFAAHMQTLKTLGFQGMSMSDLMPYLAGKPGKVVGITFDDGYRNNLTHALPVLQRHGFSATCYVVSSKIDSSGVGNPATNDWDAHQGVPQKPLMNESELRQWMALGQEIGSHTRSHADLLSLNLQALEDEIAGSRQALTERFGEPAGRHFCYPYGRYNAQTRAVVQAAGFQSATTTQRGRATAEHSPFELPRVLVSRTTGRLVLAAKLLSAYEDRRAKAVPYFEAG